MNSPVKSVQDCNNSIDRITNLTFKNPNNPLIGYLNINILRNKIVDLREICNSFSPDYFIIAETKLDQSFPSPQFMISMRLETEKTEINTGVDLLNMWRCMQAN